MRISDWSSDVCSSDLVAAILFTSGSTGVPKGVVYRHRHFVAQIQMLGAAFGIAPGAINLPTFPPFALFDPALGSRAAARRVGTECVSTCRSRWSPYH